MCEMARLPTNWCSPPERRRIAAGFPQVPSLRVRLGTHVHDSQSIGCLLLQLAPTPASTPSLAPGIAHQPEGRQIVASAQRGLDQCLDCHRKLPVGFCQSPGRQPSACTSAWLARLGTRTLGQISKRSLSTKHPMLPRLVRSCPTPWGALVATLAEIVDGNRPPCAGAPATPAPIRLPVATGPCRPRLPTASQAHCANRRPDKVPATTGHASNCPLPVHSATTWPWTASASASRYALVLFYTIHPHCVKCA